MVAGTDGFITNDEGQARDARNRREVADEIEAERFIERRIDHLRGTSQEQRVAIRRRARRRIGPDVASGTWPVLDDELLSESLRQPLTDQARDDVRRPAGSEGNNDAHRSRRIGLRDGKA